jgi:hypothetical protein
MTSEPIDETRNQTGTIAADAHAGSELSCPELAAHERSQLVDLAVNQLLRDLRHFFADEELSGALQAQLLQRLTERWNSGAIPNVRQNLPSVAGKELCRLAAEQHEHLLGLLGLVSVQHAPVWSAETVPHGHFAEQAMQADRLHGLCQAIRSNLQPDEWWLFKRRSLQNATWLELAAELKLSTEEVEKRFSEAIAGLGPRLQRYYLWLKLRPS